MSNMAAPKLVQTHRIISPPMWMWTSKTPRLPAVMQTPGVPPAITWRASRPSSSSSAPSVKQQILTTLDKYFCDVENVRTWMFQFKNWNLRRKNAHFSYTDKLHGPYVAAAFYALSKKGAVRFRGHEDWIRTNRNGKFDWDFVQYKDVPVECIDLSKSPLSYRGLDNIVPLVELRELYLRNCPYLDDWALSRLYVLKDSLEVLSLAGCPQVTERGLATLHHLQKLRHLDVSNLPSVNNKGLVRILLEEVLPGCHIVGMNFEEGLEDDEERAVATDDLRS